MYPSLGLIRSTLVPQKNSHADLHDFIDLTRKGKILAQDWLIYRWSQRDARLKYHLVRAKRAFFPRFNESERKLWFARFPLAPWESPHWTVLSSFEPENRGGGSRFLFAVIFCPVRGPLERPFEKLDAARTRPPLAAPPFNSRARRLARAPLKPALGRILLFHPFSPSLATSALYGRGMTKPRDYEPTRLAQRSHVSFLLYPV